jgi:hypothetical protein
MTSWFVPASCPRLWPPRKPFLTCALSSTTSPNRR